MDKERERKKEEIIKKVKKLVEENQDLLQNTSHSQLNNLRELVRRTQIIEEIEIYLKYQTARKQGFGKDEERGMKLIEKMMGIIKEELKIQDSPDNIKYFFGNFVRYAITFTKK